MDIQAYLNRIDYRGSLDLSLETLWGLQRAHLLAVPFENLDIAIGRPIVLEEKRLFDKLVTRRRGGFCYELNGLFAALLEALGFRVQRLAARVARAEGGFGIQFDHLALLVWLDERWLVDAGFGDSFLDPLRLDFPGEQVQERGRYQVAPDGGERLYLAWKDGRWAPQYRFSLQPFALADFAGGCHYHQTSPDSSFTRRRVCSRATPDGRITLAEEKLIITAGGQRQELDLDGEPAYAAALREHFGIEL